MRNVVYPSSDKFGAALPTDAAVRSEARVLKEQLGVA
jgi:hypothetical protein